MGNLYYDAVLSSALSVLGRWFSVDKTTILRWVISLAIALWPVVYTWINRPVVATVVYLDEKWLKIQGQWHYWFVVLDNETGLPVISSLLASKGKWACQWIGALIKEFKKIPRIFITDGMLAYDCITEQIDQRIHHILCHFHLITHYLKRNFSKDQIQQRKKVRCGFFSVVSAKRAIIFFMLMYLFIKQPETGKAPVETIMPEAKNMPFFRLVKDPINLLMMNEDVNEKIKMANLFTKETV